MGVIFSYHTVITYLRNTWTYFDETYHNYSGPHDTNDTFNVMGSKVKVTNNIFKKCSFPDGLLSKTILLSY